MKVVTCTGYYSTGSSAIADLLDEYEGCYCPPNDFELRFVYDTDGLADLEYHLVDNHNRHNSGHALKRYKKLVDFYCGNIIAPKNEAYFDGKWKKISYEYINSLTEFTFKGAWLYDYLDRGVSFHYFNSLLRKIVKKDLLANEVTYCSYPSREKFIELTKQYIEKLLKIANSEKSDIFIVDQLLPPSNIQRYVSYFDDIKAIIVERDPRDLFFLEKYIRKSNVIPDEVNAFCKWYEYTRRHRLNEDVNSDYSMLVNFEDLIYRYDEAVGLIEAFVGVKNEAHFNKYTRFKPEKSINNTQIWKRLDLSNEQKQELEIIEKNLKSFLYEFPDIEIVKNSKTKIS